MIKQVFSLFFLLTSFSFLSAQSLEEITKSYNEVVGIANDQPASALEKLNTILPQAKALGEAGSEITTNIQNMLPTVQYNVARKSYEQKDYAGAIANFEKTITLADEFKNEEIANQVKKQLPALYYSNGNTQLKAGKKAEAIQSYRKALAMNDKYAKAYYGLSKTFRGGSVDSIEYYGTKAIELAGTNAKEVASYKKGTRIGIAKAAKGKKGTEAVALYKKAIEYTEASDEKNLSKYHYKIGKAYQAAGKKSEACSAYKKVKDAKYAKSANYEMTQTLKCN